MTSPETSKLFTPWCNRSSGVVSRVLSCRLAPVQKTFYYTNPSFTSDGRYLWVICAFPPEGGRNATPLLGVVDFQRDEFRVHHETQTPSCGPMVDPLNGDVYWGNDLDVWKRGPGENDRPVRIGSFPRDVAGGQPMERLACHLTFSADRSALNLEAYSGNQTHVGEMRLDGSGVRIWQKLTGCYDHGQFSPTDSDLLLFANEFWKDHSADPFDGLRPYHRMWLIRRGGSAEPVLRAPVSHSGHEWWDADGKHVWYVHYGVGVKKVSLATRQETNLWPGHLSHAHCDKTGQYLVADLMADPKVSDCHIRFRNLKTGKEVEIVNRPPLAPNLTQCTHLHPHPQFCCNDQYICYTTIVYDRVDLALVPTKDLIARTQ